MMGAALMPEAGEMRPIAGTLYPYPFRFLYRRWGPAKAKRVSEQCHPLAAGLTLPSVPVNDLEVWCILRGHDWLKRWYAQSVKAPGVEACLS